MLELDEAWPRIGPRSGAALITTVNVMRDSLIRFLARRTTPRDWLRSQSCEATHRHPLAQP